MKKKSNTASVKYALNKKGCFTIDNYNEAKAFANFFPGIAGVWGTPMWAFYVNRGQCIASFGIESKDKAILEFQPANKAYRQTPLMGFRTFIKIKSGSKSWYWEPFQSALPGTDYKKTQKMSMSAHDLTLEEINNDLKLKVTVNYFTLPEEPYAALVRRVKIQNLSAKNYELEIVDGIPVILCYGQSDWLSKNLSRTIEAWVKVRNVDQKAPFFHLNVEVSDKPQVVHIDQGNFLVSFLNDKSVTLLDPIIESSCVFAQQSDLTTPHAFLKNDFTYPKKQYASNRSPSAFAYGKVSLPKGKQKEIVSVVGNTDHFSNMTEIVEQVTTPGFIAEKVKRNEEIIDEVKDFTFTHSANPQYNLYSGYTFMDNILRGGLPVSLKTKDGSMAFNVFSRKHGDLERDYNHFVVSPTYYSQGNGNYRDVNQNRRCDVWFNTDVKDSHLVNFLNLVQADGYNPLIVKGTSFTVKDTKRLDQVINENFDEDVAVLIREYLKKSFQPGEFLAFLTRKRIEVKTDLRHFLAEILELCQRQEVAEHGEGFWADHWTYNLDLIEQYLAIFPEDLKSLLLGRQDFTFYHSDHYVLPRDKRYNLTLKGVRQYESVYHDKENLIPAKNKNRLCEKNGEGSVYHTSLIVKLLCLIANKTATLDPSGIGVEMEADKPNWYDALNGLPGLLGSSVSETIEIKRLAQFILESFKKLGVSDKDEVVIFEELRSFVSGLNNVLALKQDPLSYWRKANDIKEHYRQRIINGIEGKEIPMTAAEIKQFLQHVITKTARSIELAKGPDGVFATYFYHEVTEYEKLDKHDQSLHPFVKPLKFKLHRLPPFLEGHVHALRAVLNKQQAKAIYDEVHAGPLFDKKLKMYKVNCDLNTASEEIGRTRIFPAGWLENESIWLHMEYKFLLELLRNGLYTEFYENIQNCFIPFLKPQVYGRSTLENSSFIVSSAHEDASLHGQGFVARLSGSTAEFLHMWLLMNFGANPFRVDTKGQLTLQFEPALPAWLFAKSKSQVSVNSSVSGRANVALPSNTYACNFLGSTLVVYHNPKRKDTFGEKKGLIKEMHFFYANSKKPEIIKSSVAPVTLAHAVRNREITRIDVFLS